MIVTARPVRMLYVGALWHGSTSRSRALACRTLGLSLETVDVTSYCISGPRLLRAIERRVSVGPGIWALNRAITVAVTRFQPELVFIDKGIYVWPLTVRNIKRMAAAAVVHYLPDDYYGSGLHLRLVTRAICDYDAVFTTKTYNVRELERAGVTRVQYVPNAYDPLLHRPPELTEAERRIYGCDISFIGRWEPDRQETLTHLAEKGYKMKIWGDGWNKAGIPDRLRPCVQGRGVFGAEYAKAIAASSINLNILSKWYRDEETQRSIEIPACAGFMLAERTARHLEYFEEGKEAEFYSCEGELSEKCSYYIEHPADAQSIGAAGRQRCIRSDYSYADRINSIFDYLAEEHLL